MYIPSPASKTPRFFQPCPGNDEYQLEPGMFGIKDVSGGSEAWYRPFKTLVGDANPNPILIATAADIAAIVAGYVAKATFDANTILKADTDDTPVALPVGASTIIGRASTGGIAALSAAQVATIINSSIAHNSTSGLNTGDYQHVNPSPVAGGTGWDVAASDYISSSTDASSVKPVDSILRYDTGTIAGVGDLGGFSFDGDFLYANDSDVDLRFKIDPSNGEIIDSYGGYTQSYDPYVGWPGKGSIKVENTQLVHFPPTMDTHTVITYSVGTNTYPGAAYVIKDHLYIIDALDNLIIYDLASKSEISKTAISGITDEVNAICVDNDETYVWLLDELTTGATSGRIRRINIATKLIDVSAAGTITSNLSYNARMKCSGEFVELALYNGTGMALFLINKTTLATAFSGSSIGQAFATAFTDFGFVISASSSVGQLKAYSTPALASVQPKQVDLTKSETVLFKHYCSDGLYTDQSLINAKLYTDILRQSHLGVTVESVETTVPTPADDKLYLIQGGTTAYEGYVVWNSTALGVQIVPRKNGSKVNHGYFTYTYQVDRWEKTFEIVHTQELEMTTGVANPTAELYLSGVLSSGEAIVCDTCSVIATMKTASSRYISKMEAIIAYDDTDEGTQRKEIDTLTGSIGLTSVDFVIKSGNYYGGLPSDGDIQAELVMTGTPTLTRTFNVTFHISGSVHTGLGDYCGV